MRRTGPLAVLLLGCASGDRGAAWETPAYFSESIRVSLADGDIGRAVDLAERAHANYPDDGALLAWRALLAQMRWREIRALSYLGQLREFEDYGGIDKGELLGRIGDVLFRSGAYADSVPYLTAGSSGPHGARRAALVDLARELPYSRLQPSEFVAELPLMEGPLPQLLCTVLDRQRPFALDTGASFTTLTEGAARELRVDPIVSAGFARDGTGREFPVSFGVLHSLSLGTVELSAQPVLVVSDEVLALRDAWGGPSRASTGVVGLDILARFRVTFDPGRTSVVFELPRGLDLPDTVDCVQHDGRCLVPVRVEGRDMWFVLDTGASHSSLTEDGLARLPGGARRARSSFRRVRTPGGGDMSVREVESLSLRVSAVRFDGVTLSVVSRPGTRLFPTHGVLGADLLMRCRFTFDRGRLLVEAL